VVQRAFLGVAIEDVDNERARELGLPSAQGVYVTRVNADGGAADAGLRDGDVILGLNDVRLKRTPELQELVGRFRPGQELTVEYWRQGKKYKTRVVLKDSRNTTSVARVAGDELQDDIGIELRDVNKEEQRVLRMPGALVTSVKRGSIVYDTNMQPGFLITSVNGNRVSNASEAIDAIKRAYNSLALDGYYEGEPDLYSYRFKKRE